MAGRGRSESAPQIPAVPPARADELQRLRRELSRERERHPLRIVISGDPRRPMRTIVLHARWPVLAAGLVGALVLAALGLGAVTYLLRRSLGRLETRMTEMTETADHLALHPLPDHMESHVEAPEELARPGDLPARAAVKPRAAIPAAQLGRFHIEVVNNGEQLEVLFDLATGEMEEKSYRALRRLMRCQRTGAETPIDPRLIELLHTIARRTSGKILLVSGFRAPMFSTAKLSYHTRGMAADIRIPGMTPLMVRDLVMGMGVKGVGYYPVSQFVHVDVRDEKAYWVDSGAAREESESNAHTE
jgi:uncharacterized protein YcbK (DUF882 family)